MLTLAADDERLLITHNVRDFLSIPREWAAAQRSHAGVILVYGIDHSEFELIAHGIEKASRVLVKGISLPCSAL